MFDFKIWADKENTYQPDSYVEENTFLTTAQEKRPLPTFEDARPRLPSPLWEGHEDVIRCYWRVWEIAFGNLRQPVTGTHFVSNFIDTAFNGCLFMWDSCFILMFGKYGSRVFPFQKTLDNFYSHQHKDGFISREICEADSSEKFVRYDPDSTGPNLLPWCEWEYFENHGDTERIRRIFPALMAYHRWLHRFRTWPDGSLFTSGLGSGMDNAPRVMPGCDPEHSHGHMVWVDYCMIQALNCELLTKMAAVIGRTDETGWLQQEREQLIRLINERLWDESTAYYYDLWRDGRLNMVKTVGSYWALIAGIVPADRLDRFVAHLDNEQEFKRPHRVPTLSADHPAYSATGSYWRGSVWAPTNYMILRGLRKQGCHDLVYDIACNHLDNVVQCFQQTGTVFENYAPESTSPGSPAARDFVGWTGLVPISVLFEYVFGIEADVPHNRLVWHVRRLERHGIDRYPFGSEGTLSLHCEPREKATDKPAVTVETNIPLTVDVIWEGGRETLSFS